MLRLKCVAQSYAWGRSATDSEVAQLAIADGASIDDQKPYAELWMGTHPSGPSMLAANGQSLKGWLLANPQALGDAVIQHFGTDLPFLFKVLSVRTALSIQSHPDKALAKQLHAERPEVYKDGNHKPEMALALTAFEALCGFVQHEDLVRALALNPELREVIGEVNAALLASAWDDSLKKEGLRAAFTALMTADAAAVSAAIDRLTVRLQAASQQRPLSPKEALLLRLNQQYPQDVGVLSVFFLNLVSLPAGDAIYLAANQPHAYLAGELMEVMATSDNVLRAGLTPKLRDTGVLCSSLTYSQGFPEVLHGTPAGPHVRMYSPPFEEFELAAISLPAGESMTLAANPGPQLLMVQLGSGAAAAKSPPGVGFGDGNELQQRTDLTRGQVWFIPANTAIELSTPVSSTEPLFMWSAACNAIVFSQIAAPEVEAIPSRIREKVLTLV